MTTATKVTREWLMEHTTSGIPRIEILGWWRLKQIYHDATDARVRNAIEKEAKRYGYELTNLIG